MVRIVNKKGANDTPAGVCIYACGYTGSNIAPFVNCCLPQWWNNEWSNIYQLIIGVDVRLLHADDGKEQSFWCRRLTNSAGKQVSQYTYVPNSNLNLPVGSWCGELWHLITSPPCFFLKNIKNHPTAAEDFAASAVVGERSGCAVARPDRDRTGIIKSCPADTKRKQTSRKPSAVWSPALATEKWPRFFSFAFRWYGRRCWPRTGSWPANRLFIVYSLFNKVILCYKNAITGSQFKESVSCMETNVRVSRSGIVAIEDRRALVAEQVESSSPGTLVTEQVASSSPGSVGWKSYLTHAHYSRLLGVGSLRCSLGNCGLIQ